MHIEPGMVEVSKVGLSYISAGAAIGLSAKFTWEHIKDQGMTSLLFKSLLAIICVFLSFEVLPHEPVGVSEVHLIMGSTLLLIFGIAPAAIGLIMGLLIQGVFFAPFDLPQFGMNVTTLIMPLVVMSYLAKKIIDPKTAYKDLSYSQAFKLSTAYQGGIVAWVGFWAFYGQGFGAENVASISSFGLAYMTVIIVEPFVDLAVLALAKQFPKLAHSPFVANRVFSAAS